MTSDTRVPATGAAQDDGGQGSATMGRTTGGPVASLRVWILAHPWWLRVAWSLLVVQLLVRGWLTGPAFFNMDDFLYLADAETSSFWPYVTQYYNGHLMPLGFAMVWILQRAWPMEWAPYFWLLMVLNLWSSVLWIRLARALFPPSSWLVVPTAIMFFCPLWWNTSIWFASGIQIIPLTIATLGVLLHATGYHTDRSRRRVVWAGAYLVFGLLMWEKSLLLWIPLIGLYAGFLRPGRLGWTAVRTSPMLWVLGATSTLYALAYVAGLPATPLDDSPSVGDLLATARIALVGVLIPATFGGSWSAPSGGVVGVGQPPDGWVQAACAQAAIAIVLVSVSRWRPAWRAWALMAAYLLAALGLFAFSRLDGFGLILATDPRYVEDALAVFCLCLTLAFLRPISSPLPPSPPLPERHGILAITVAGVVAGNLYALSTLQVATMWREARAKSYVQTLRSEVQRVGPLAVADRQVPAEVMAPLFLERGNASNVMRAARLPIQWDGPGDVLYVLRDDGSLGLGTLAPASSSLPGRSAQCAYPAGDGELAIPMDTPLYNYVWGVRVSYRSDTAALGQLRLGRGRATPFPIRPGERDLWVVTTGDPRVVRLTLPAGSEACINHVEVGTLQ